ncbi:guanitoxin biosynthesis L-enduracididine beta-hydroxylase GntD [Nostoc sp.]|uniref:guanitoxin biosynthesis L-enduracididine beta-hydroxylase GntD n=1 Tax=Nostoc sp. TaxID=1180 RepID=UPI002FF569FD
MSIQTLNVTKAELEEIDLLLDQVTANYSHAEQSELIDASSVLAQGMPLRIRQFLHEFKLQETAPACLIKGYTVNDSTIGATPEHWAGHKDANRTKREQIMFVLCSSLLGEIFSWLTQQNAYLIHDVFPIKGYEQDQIGSGSEALLLWHTEDAYHPARGDYLGLMCLRNPCNSVTTIGSVDSLKKLTQGQLDILFQARFIIRPDNAHQADNNYHKETALDAKIENAYNQIKHKIISQENAMPLLYGEPSAPYLCVDPAYMEAIDEEAKQALQALINAIDAELMDVILQPGDICFVDNFRAVHGRKPFKANYDGHDRWLKRINITRDLRKSRTYRSNPTSRIIDKVAS